MDANKTLDCINSLAKTMTTPFFSHSDGLQHMPTATENKRRPIHMIASITLSFCLEYRVVVQLQEWEEVLETSLVQALGVCLLSILD